MAHAGLQPISWGYFYGVVNSKEFEVMTAETCCCRICRNFGWETFEQLRDLVHRLDAAIRIASGPERDQGLAHLAALLKSVEEVARFYRSGEFQRHLEFESSDPEHCMCRLLSAFNDPHFRQPCSHTRSDGTVGQDPESMLQWYRREYQSRAAKVPSQFWNGYCEVSSTLGARQLSWTSRMNALTLRTPPPYVPGTPSTATRTTMRARRRRHVVATSLCVLTVIWRLTLLVFARPTTIFPTRETGYARSA